ncbi:conserved domain protein [Verrucomicrobiia bacterium DG1235]|nr:conserved domain protein [Verrucomicrobiae bacterium DG1235]
MISNRTKFIASFVLVLIGVHAIAEDLEPLDWEELSKTSPWVYTEVNRDVPVVAPGKQNAAPSDAVVLFDGSDLSSWEKTPFGEGVRMDRTEHFLKNYKGGASLGPAAWGVENGEIVAGMKQGAIASKQAFGDMQLHIEWQVPVLEDKQGQEYGNSGIFLMGLYEIQVLNSYQNETYSNGQAAAIYKQHVPLVNASRAPGNWQTYDILFTAPRFSEKGSVISPALVTILHNGVLVQHNAVLQGPTSFIGEPYYVPHPAKLPIVLQDHDNPVRYRNIWVREL